MLDAQAMTIPEKAVQAGQNVIRTANWEYGITDADMAKALTAAAPYMSGSAREQALEEGFRKGTEAAAKLIECGCKDLLHGKGECHSPGNCSLEDAAEIRALSYPDHAGAGKVEWNTRPAPAATDTGLVTVGWLWEYAQYRTDDRGYYGYETVITESNPTDHVSPAEKLRNVRELVTRQNAEEVIAAERMKLEASAKVGLQLSEQIEAFEADNAAKDARIAELEAKLETANALVTCCCGSLVNDHDMGSGHSPVDQYHYAMVQLESDNKRLREALEPFANVAEHDIGGDEDDGDIFWPMSNARYSMAGRLRVGDLRRARTALRERE